MLCTRVYPQNKFSTVYLKKYDGLKKYDDLINKCVSKLPQAAKI